MSKILITGGCGFVGTNVALNLSKNSEVYCIDNLVKPESKNNEKLLISNGLNVINQDITNKDEMGKIIKKLLPDYLIHLGAQVAMSSSIDDPINDLNINLLGTFNILDSLRSFSPDTKLINISTNKVYGDLFWDELSEKEKRYHSKNHSKGYSENTPLSFSGPYGCSKGAAEQYVLDYYKTYNINTTSLRLSTIYGPNQYATYNQGWIGWFLGEVYKKQNEKVLEISMHGNGKQVRDILYINDFINLINIIISDFEKVNGEVFNIGGSLNNSISIIELLDFSREFFNLKGDYKLIKKDWRLADQRFYVSDIDKISKLTGWNPKVSLNEGLKEFSDWISERN